MGLLNRIFGRKEKITSSSHNHHNAAVKSSKVKINIISDEMLSISEIDYVGSYSTSPSGDWLITWSDSAKSLDGSIIVGHRDSGHGRYILYNLSSKEIVTSGELERPNNGNVSNNGTFCLEDWLFTSKLSSAFYVISKEGDQLLKKTFTANSFNNGISENGTLVICQTSNSPTIDGNLLTAFNVKNGSTCFSINNEFGWADSYKFNEASLQFGVVQKSIGTFYYDIDGNFIDPHGHQKARLNSKDRYISMSAAEEITKDKNQDNALTQKVIKLCLSAIKMESYENKALAYKILGSAYELIDDKEKALDAFNIAIVLNPKIGVKRKITTLSKKLGLS